MSKDKISEQLKSPHEQKLLDVANVDACKSTYDTSKATSVKYKNYRNEVATRTIIPIKIYWGKTDFHPREQWILKVWDVEKNAERDYAFNDIQEFNTRSTHTIAYRGVPIFQMFGQSRPRRTGIKSSWQSVVRASKKRIAQCKNIASKQCTFGYAENL